MNDAVAAATVSSTAAPSRFTRDAVGFSVFCLLYASLELAFFSRGTGNVLFYKQNIARVRGVDVKDVHFDIWPYGVLSYAVLFAAAWYFLGMGIVRGTAAMRDVRRICLRAALLGLAIFGVHNLMNAATLKGNDAAFVVYDTLWGVFSLTATALSLWVLVGAWHRFR